MGIAEAFYRLIPSLHLKFSNIGTRFVSTSFPSNRSRMSKHVTDEESQCYSEVFETEDGKIVLCSTLHDYYANRPPELSAMPLFQFSQMYSLKSQEDNDEQGLIS